METELFNCYISGDIHGDYAPVDNFYRNHRNELSGNRDKDVIILLGDVGGNYYLNKKDDFFKEKLSKYPFTYFCIRGNHEQRPSVLAEKYPSDWHQESAFGNIVWVEDRYPYILYALDEGGEYLINGKSILVIPGAYSVDKEYRLMRHWSWFPGEQLSAEERAALRQNLKPHYDVILSHTCPYSWQSYISDLFLSQVDQSKVDNTTEKFLDEIAVAASYDRWYWGHYHDDRDIPITNGTMLFHQYIPFGMSISKYQFSCLTK